MSAWGSYDQKRKITLKGGTAIIVKKELKQSSRTLRANGKASLVAVQVEGVTIASTYAPPTEEGKKQMSELLRDWQEETTPPARTLIAGDWNIDAAQATRPDGESHQAVDYFLAQPNYRIVATKQPTRWIKANPPFRFRTSTQTHPQPNRKV